LLTAARATARYASWRPKSRLGAPTFAQNVGGGTTYDCGSIFDVAAAIRFVKMESFAD
jgi:hypothetical protein